MTATENRYLRLEDRALIAVAGPEARPFLQNLVSNDIDKVSAARAVYAALLTPQGKFLHDFFVLQSSGAMYMDCEAARRDDLLRRLTMYRLRAKVALEALDTELAVLALYGDGSLQALGLKPEAGAAREWGGGVAYVDPRLSDLGARAVVPASAVTDVAGAAGFRPGDAADYDRLRLSLGIPDGSRDLEVEKAVLLENGFDELHGVDWHKGCFVGQELTARMYHRGLVKKRLMPVAVDGPLPPTGTPIVFEGREAGIMRSGRDGIGLALLRLDAAARAEAQGAALTAGDATLTPCKPGWLTV